MNQKDYDEMYQDWLERKEDELAERYYEKPVSGEIMYGEDIGFQKYCSQQFESYVDSQEWKLEREDDR